MDACSISGLKEYILDMAETACEIQRQLTALPALGPENGGQGEIARAEFVGKRLATMGLKRQKRVDSPDPRVESGIRPNLICEIPGKSSRKLWLFGHLDVVPPGDLTAWRSDPWQIRREGDLVYGRGVEDNQQAVTSMLLLAKALTSLRLEPSLTLELVFMADEECGSKHGLEWILNTKPEMFGKDDFYLVPDGGSPDASLMEVAEKAQLWLEFEVIGKQCHASMPEEGVNALVAASRLICSLQDLNLAFPGENRLFKPPTSTFVPTRHDQNTPGINVLPGKDIFYMDCRLLPHCEKKDALAQIDAICGKIAEICHVSINFREVQWQAASATPPGAPVVEYLASAIKSVYGVEAKPIGIGGATVAAFLRQRSLPAVVWSCIRNTCHMPNECSSLSATCRDAAVFGQLVMTGAE